jgi:cytochrome c oxidase cbb3-type subunit 3
MAVSERDPVSGYLTTGHEWNGIKELNTPVPWVVYAAIAITHLFALAYWVAMPAFPTLTSFTKGVLGRDDRAIVQEAVKQADTQRAVWARQVDARSFAEIQNDKALMGEVRQAGRALFGDNCSVCHGRDAKGGPGFPNLTTQSWLWGGTPEAIAETIRVGVNAPHAKTRNSQMPGFGQNSMLPRTDMENVVAYVRSLAKMEQSLPVDRVQAGQSVFTANCVACHGADAKGKTDVGAPNLTDHYWMHGRDEASMYMAVWGGLQGRMPAWEGRLTPTERKILALYLIDLRGRP